MMRMLSKYSMLYMPAQMYSDQAASSEAECIQHSLALPGYTYWAKLNQKLGKLFCAYFLS